MTSLTSLGPRAGQAWRGSLWTHLTVWPVIAAASDSYLHNHNPLRSKLRLRPKVMTLLVFGLATFMQSVLNPAQNPFYDLD